MNVSAIIVTFNPIIENLSLLITELCSQTFSVIVVDNGSSNSSEIRKLATVYHNLEVIFLPDNVGIAAAQNIGIRKSIQSNAQFSFFFDQDSKISNNFVSQMVRDYLCIKATKPIAALGPTLRDNRYGKIYPVIRLNKLGLREKIIPDITSSQPLDVSCIIASGSLIETSVLFDGNCLMNEELFIDYVDTEWCLRMISRGYGIYVTPNVIMEHEIGDEHIKMFSLVIPVHSANRRYYRVRNGFYLFKMDHVPKLLAVREVIFSLIHQIILCVYKKDTAYIRLYFRSLIDVINK